MKFKKGGVSYSTALLVVGMALLALLIVVLVRLKESTGLTT